MFQLSRTAQLTAERTGRKMIRLLEARAATGEQIGCEAVQALSYDLIEGNIETATGYARWLDMRSVAELVAYDAHPEWNNEPEPGPYTPVAYEWPADMQEIVG